MDEFTGELNTLLQKYPNLPEFTLVVRPRITIEVKKTIQTTPIAVAPKPIEVDPALPPVPANLARLKDSMVTN